MLRYPALIDGENGAYGVTFPDLPGVVAMAETMDQALVNAEDALRDYAIETEKDGQAPIAPSAIEDVTPPAGSTLISIPLIHLSGRSIRANMMLDEGVISFIDSEAKRRGMTRTSYVEWMARRIAQAGG